MVRYVRDRDLLSVLTVIGARHAIVSTVSLICGSAPRSCSHLSESQY
jgi:hypothetical protein